MKNKKIIFFLVGSLLLLILFTFSLLKLYDHYIYQALNQMVYSLEEEYPDIDIRLVEALTHQEEANDILGKYDEFCPKFARQYSSLKDIIFNVARAYCNDVENGNFPSIAESFTLDINEAQKLENYSQD